LEQLVAVRKFREVGGIFDSRWKLEAHSSRTDVGSQAFSPLTSTCILVEGQVYAAELS